MTSPAKKPEATGKPTPGASGYISRIFYLSSWQCRTYIIYDGNPYLPVPPRQTGNESFIPSSAANVE